MLLTSVRDQDPNTNWPNCLFTWEVASYILQFKNKRGNLPYWYIHIWFLVINWCNELGIKNIHNWWHSYCILCGIKQIYLFQKSFHPNMYFSSFEMREGCWLFKQSNLHLVSKLTLYVTWALGQLSPNQSIWGNGILFPKLFWPTMRKKRARNWEKILKFETEDREFSKYLISLWQFIQAVKCQHNFWNKMLFDLFLEAFQI